MTIKTPSERHVTTLLYLLRGYAEQQRRMHGAMVERPGGLELTPLEMEAWADELEAQALSDNSKHCEYHKQFEYDCMECIDTVQPSKEALPDNSTEGWLDT